MVSKQELTKRRVAATRSAEREAAAAAKRARRRRLWIGVGVGTLAVAMIAPLTAGLFLAARGDDEPIVTTNDTIPLTTEAPTLVDDEFAGTTLEGPTPCPATDGTQERVTTFESAPPANCLDESAAYRVEIDTPAGYIDINLDAELAPEAASLFVALAEYGAYEGAPVTPFDGLTVLGGWGSAGFTVLATEPPADGLYPVGSVVMLAEIGQPLMEGRIVLVTSQAGADALATDPTSPIIGTITSDLEIVDDLNGMALSATGGITRVDAVDVTAVATE